MRCTLFVQGLYLVLPTWRFATTNFSFTAHSVLWEGNAKRLEIGYDCGSCSSDNRDFSFFSAFTNAELKEWLLALCVPTSEPSWNSVVRAMESGGVMLWVRWLGLLFSNLSEILRKVKFRFEVIFSEQLEAFEGSRRACFECLLL